MSTVDLGMGTHEVPANLMNQQQAPMQQQGMQNDQMMNQHPNMQPGIPQQMANDHIQNPMDPRQMHNQVAQEFADPRDQSMTQAAPPSDTVAFDQNDLLNEVKQRENQVAQSEQERQVQSNEYQENVRDYEETLQAKTDQYKEVNNKLEAKKEENRNQRQEIKELKELVTKLNNKQTETNIQNTQYEKGVVNSKEYLDLREKYQEEAIELKNQVSHWKSMHKDKEVRLNMLERDQKIKDVIDANMPYLTKNCIEGSEVGIRDSLRKHIDWEPKVGFTVTNLDGSTIKRKVGDLSMTPEKFIQDKFLTMDAYAYLQKGYQNRHLNQNEMGDYDKKTAMKKPMTPQQAQQQAAEGNREFLDHAASYGVNNPANVRVYESQGDFMVALRQYPQIRSLYEQGKFRAYIREDGVDHDPFGDA